MPPAESRDLERLARQQIFSSLAAVRRAEVFDGRRAETILDVVRSRPTEKRCWRGPLSSTVSSTTIRNRRGVCVGFKCPHCVDYRIAEVVMRALRLWDFPETVYRYELPKSDKHARTVRAEHPLYFCAAGILFSPAPIESGERVEALPTLLEAILNAPAQPNRKVFSFSRSQLRRDRERDVDAPKAEPGSITRYARHLGSLGALNVRYEAALGERVWSAEPGRRSTAFSAASSTALQDEREHDVAVEVCLEIGEEDKEAMADLRRRLAEVDSSEVEWLMDLLAEREEEEERARREYEAAYGAYIVNTKAMGF